MRHKVFFCDSNFVSLDFYTRVYRTLRIASFGSGGRNNLGRTTAFHRGRKLSRPFYLLCDFFRFFVFFCPGLLLGTNFQLRFNHFGVVLYDNGYVSLYPVVEGLVEGDMVLNSNLGFLRLGAILPVSFLSLGSVVNHVCFLYNYRNVFSSSAGTFSRILKKSQHFGVLELPSTEKRIVHTSQGVFLGKNSQFQGRLGSRFTKAGELRCLGRRPVVRGVAMNPIDHPHGGGQGKTSGGQPSVSPWGVYTKGTRTRSRTSTFRIKRRTKNKSFLSRERA